jgi:V/A-type H+-transporting ATPase subunit I
MIVPMKRITLLCSAGDADASLEVLRELGVLHLSHVRPPEGGDLEEARARLSYLARALEVLPSSESPPSGRTAAEVAQDAWCLIHERQRIEQELEPLEYERKRVAPYGTFDPVALRRLRDHGLFVKICVVAGTKPPPVPEGSLVHPLRIDRRSSAFAVVARSDFAVEGAEEFRLPEASLDVLVRRVGEARRSLEGIGERLRGLGRDRPEVAREVRRAEERLRFLEARAGMGVAAPVAYLRGYCPTDKAELVAREAPRRGWAVLAEDPADAEPVPTLLRNSPWIKPIKAVFDMIGILPGYREIDISISFLFFLSLFFAMLVGDAGYGLLFLALTAWARRKLPRAAAQPFLLMFGMSLWTIGWGVITGTYFGITDLPAPLRGLRIDWLGNDRNLMLLCFTIGAIHLTVAHLWNVRRSLRSPQALAQLGWVGMTWTMYFLARMMVLGDRLPGWVLGMAAASCALIVLFMTPPRQLKDEWFNHVMLPLSFVSNFVDVVSYLRLFAVGSASLAVAASFNEMALGGGVHSVVAGLAAALILFAGHTLNVLLAAMGVLVHGVRLNTLEFSSHIGMQWTGVPYQPFRRLPGADTA